MLAREIDGDWKLQNENDNKLFKESATFVNGHDVILQSLDKMVNGWQLNVEMFKDTLDLWDGLDVIFSTDGYHPDPTAYAEDKFKALEEVHGAVVGHIQNPQINTVGSAKLVGTVTGFELYPEIEKFLSNGDLNVSTAFFIREGRVIPNHVLVWSELRSGVEQGDPMAVFLNNDSHTKLESKIINAVMEKVKALFGQPNIVESELQNTQSEGEDKDMAEEVDSDIEKLIIAKEQKITELTNTIEGLSTDKDTSAATIVELTAKLGELETAQATMNTELETYKAAEEEKAQAERDALWNTVKATYLKPADTKGDGSEDTLRAEFEANPANFIMSRQNEVVKNTKFVNEAGNEIVDGEHKPSAIGRRSYNPETAKFETV